ncbi:peptidoglycan-binding domain-containing protein [Mastigocladopsis repens]|uniref:peptidoglycan-binding domain-containing protein n=1 Tax=Mastigocladopsis repens TaxID=221287 RepID=UPI0003730A4A|nr:peptidoglycan-binding domain-containing protein [Mastigocladopsis repens]
MTDIALLMTGVLRTGQPSPPIAPELPLVQQDSDQEKSTQGQLSQIVSAAQITPPEFMQSERTAQAAASVVTIENKSILNPIEINILSEIPCLVGSENFQFVGKDTTENVIAQAQSFHVCPPERLLSFNAIPKLVAQWRNSVRSFPTSPLKESKKMMLASTYFVGFQLASDNLPSRTSNRRQQRPTRKQGSSQTVPQKNDSQSLPTLSFGDSGVTVRVLQRLLSSNGYTVDVDGVFGALTETAVQAFQKQRNLGVDGIVGQRTWYELTK